MLYVVADGQYGDTGKGKVSTYLFLMHRMQIAARPGSVNAGHTINYNGLTHKLKQIPGAALFEWSQLKIPAGAMIDPGIFLDEVKRYGVQDRIKVDYRAGIILPEHIEQEKNEYDKGGNAKTIGTTQRGIGPARIGRLKRVGATLARDVPVLAPYLADVSAELGDALRRKQDVMIEGVQGFNLSLYHGDPPYQTTIDTTASAFLSECGLGPRYADQVWLVFKSYITRVGEGPLGGEMSFEEAQRRGIEETATNTGRKRRSAMLIDGDFVNHEEFAKMRKAVTANSPTHIAVTCVDRLFPDIRGVKRAGDIPSNGLRRFVEIYEKELGAKVSMLGTGPELEDMVGLPA